MDTHNTVVTHRVSLPAPQPSDAFGVMSPSALPHSLRSVALLARLAVLALLCATSPPLVVTAQPAALQLGQTHRTTPSNAEQHNTAHSDCRQRTAQ